MRYTFYVLLGYQLVGEIVQQFQGKILHIRLFTVIDTLSLGLNTFILLNQSLKLEIVSLAWQRAMATYGIMLMYTKIFYWLRMSQDYALAVRVLNDVAYDMRVFLVMLFGVVALFGNAVYILDLGRLGEANEIFPPIGQGPARSKLLGSLAN